MENEATAKITEGLVEFFEPEDRFCPWESDVLESIVSVLHELGLSDDRVFRSAMFIIGQKIADDFQLTPDDFKPTEKDLLHLVRNDWESRNV